MIENNKITKINWFKRFFWSWKKLCNHFQNFFQNKEEWELQKKELEETKIILKETKEEKKWLMQELIDLKSDFKSNKHTFERGVLRLDENKKNHNKIKEENSKLQTNLEVLNQKLKDSEETKNNLETKIFHKLTTLDQIQKTFFNKGNQGKGFLGELQLENILEKANLPEGFWEKNLMVGSKQVEFAIKSGHKNKWIPVDSKVLEISVDENNAFIIDKDYKDKIIAQVKKIEKYLNKSNTAEYGLLILQNDAIYIKLFDKFPQFFSEIIQKNKIYILSPSSFIQFAWSLSNILEIYQKFKKEENIYKEIIDLSKSCLDFAKNIKTVYQKFKISIETHFPRIEKKQNIFSKNWNNKKEIPSLAKLEDKKSEN